MIKKMVMNIFTYITLKGIWNWKFMDTWNSKPLVKIFNYHIMLHVCGDYFCKFFRLLYIDKIIKLQSMTM